MKAFTAILLGALVLTGCATSDGGTDTHPHHAHANSERVASALKLETLLSTKLEGVPDTDVIVSRVYIPPHTSLPKHWHPGEEFAYVLDGSVTLWQKGKEEIIGHKGDAMKVPLNQVHTAITKEQGVTLLVFRVHEQGKPERTLVE